MIDLSLRPSFYQWSNEGRLLLSIGQESHSLGKKTKLKLVQAPPLAALGTQSYTKSAYLQRKSPVVRQAHHERLKFPELTAHPEPVEGSQNVVFNQNWYYTKRAYITLIDQEAEAMRQAIHRWRREKKQSRDQLE